MCALDLKARSVPVYVLEKIQNYVKLGDPVLSFFFWTFMPKMTVRKLLTKTVSYLLNPMGVEKQICVSYVFQTGISSSAF